MQDTIPRAVSILSTWRPDDAVGFWTMALTLATTALAVVAALGLRAIRLAKKDIAIRSLRDAKSCALARCEDFAQKIIASNAANLAAISTAGIPVFVKSASEVDFEHESAEEIKKAEAWAAGLPAGLPTQFVRFLNDMEAWAAYFVHGVADETVACGPCAPAYCIMVVQLYPILIVQRSKPSSGKYPNLVKLFQAWQERLNNEQRGLAAGDLLKQLAELQTRPAAQYLLPAPIGTLTGRGSK